MKYYLHAKKKEILPFVTVWMDLENIMLSELGQSQKDKFRMISFTWNLMTKLTTKQNRGRHTQGEQKSNLFIKNCVFFLHFNFITFKVLFISYNTLINLFFPQLEFLNSSILRLFISSAIFCFTSSTLVKTSPFEDFLFNLEK